MNIILSTHMLHVWKSVDNNINTKYGLPLFKTLPMNIISQIPTPQTCVLNIHAQVHDCAISTQRLIKFII